MPLTPSQSAMKATNEGAPAQTIQPLEDADDATSGDVRTFPSNGAIPDEVRSLIPSQGYHVP